MNIGFIGAGKAGTALGRYLVDNNASVVGFASKTYSSACQAASFSRSSAFSSTLDLVRRCDFVFITTPDSVISIVWRELLDAHKQHVIDLSFKSFAHCSGCCSSELFAESHEFGVSVCSIHPLLAFGDSSLAVKQLNTAHICVEGDDTALNCILPFFETAGNQIHRISSADKVRYHAAAVFASNLVLAPLDCAVQLLKGCGFDSHDATVALAPLIKNNIDNFFRFGSVGALTGPVERADKTIVSQHLSALSEKDAELYCALSQKLIDIAKRKHPDRDYEGWDAILLQANNY